MTMLNPGIWTPAARRVVQLAREEAALRQGPAGTGDLLAALLFSGEGLGLMQQRRLGIPTRQLRRTWKLWKAEPPEPVDADVPGETSAFRAALLATGRSGREMVQSYLSCEHLMLGLLVDPQCEASQRLRESGVERGHLWEKVVCDLGLAGLIPDPMALDAGVASPESEPAWARWRVDLIRRYGLLPSKGAAPDSGPPWARWKADLVRRYGQPPPSTADSTLSNGTRPFTPRAQLAMDSAVLEARRRQLGSLNTDTLLLGVLHVGHGCAVNALRRLGINPGSLGPLLGADPSEAATDPAISDTPGLIPFSPEVKRALRQANLEAGMHSHAYVGTEHLVLGMLHETDHPAARALSAGGIELATFRNAVLDELDPGRHSESFPAT